jgi:hypothetical protein
MDRLIYLNVRPVESRQSFYAPHRHGAWSIHSLEPETVRRLTRLTVDQLLDHAPRLLGVSGIKYRRRYFAPPDLALFVTSIRLAHPDRLYWLCGLIGRSIGWRSVVFNDIVDYLQKRWETTVAFWPEMDHARCLLYGGKVHTALNFGDGDCWRFIDGMFQVFCALEGNELQRTTYASYYGANGLKCQSIGTPDRLIVSYTPPFECPAYDQRIFNAFDTTERLRTLCEGLRTLCKGLGPLRRHLYVIGDNAYSGDTSVIAPQAHAFGRTFSTAE